MKPQRQLPSIGGLPMDPRADMALPLLLILASATTVALCAGMASAVFDLRLLPGIAVVAFIFAVESYLFTTIFTVRDVDAPDALRWVEMALILALGKVLASIPAAAGLKDALLGAYESWDTWVGFGLLLFAWLDGMKVARLIRYLHPGHMIAKPGQELLVHDDHGQAYTSVLTSVCTQVGVTGILLGIMAWATGDVRVWGWSWLGVGLLLLMALGAGAMLVAAQLRQRITWAQEGLATPPEVDAHWAPAGLAMLLVPALLALLLPAGPRLPVERFIAFLGRLTGDAKFELPPQEQPNNEQPVQLPQWMVPEGAESRLQIHIPPWVWYVLGAIPVLLLLRAAARQLVDRVKAKDLKGLWAILAVVANWYLALWQGVREMLWGVLKQAVAAPAQAVGHWLGETGVLGRYLPFRGRAPAEPRAAVRFYFARLQVEAARKGVERQAAVTAGEFADRLAGQAPERAGEIAELNQAYSLARYSAEPVPVERVSYVKRAWVEIARALGRKRPDPGQ